MRRTRVAMALSAGAVIVASSASCLDPTQMTVAMRTDVRCDLTRGTRFSSAAAPERAEAAAPDMTTTRCQSGEIGTVVASPSDGKEGRAAFLVVMGVDVPVADCTVANGFKGCIVQRRSLSYVKHTPLRIPIAMLLVCKDKVCDAKSTCARSGKCVSSEIVDPERCAEGDCYPEGDGPEPRPGEDGGNEAASGTDGAPREGGSGDGGPGDGGPGDAGGVEGSVAPQVGRLFCPPLPNGCTAGEVCCWDNTVATASGVCSQALCPPRQVELKCNRKADCSGGELCCGTVITSIDPPERKLTQTGCVPSVNPCIGSFICLQTSDCPTGATCNKNTDLFKPSGFFGECVF